MRKLLMLAILLTVTSFYAHAEEKLNLTPAQSACVASVPFFMSGLIDGFEGKNIDEGFADTMVAYGRDDIVGKDLEIVKAIYVNGFRKGVEGEAQGMVLDNAKADKMSDQLMKRCLQSK